MLHVWSIKNTTGVYRLGLIIIILDIAVASGLFVRGWLDEQNVPSEEDNHDNEEH
jgi:hypothetical protein